MTEPNLEQMEIGMQYAITDLSQRLVGNVLVVPGVAGFDSVELWAYDASFKKGGTYTFTKSARTLPGGFEQQRAAFREEQKKLHADWLWVEASCTKPATI